jgi:hypothetical protein
VAAFSCLYSLGCIRKTNFVRVAIGTIEPHQHNAFGQKHR